MKYGSVADPGFPRGDANLLFDKIFAETCMKMKEIGQSKGAFLAPSLGCAITVGGV